MHHAPMVSRTTVALPGEGGGDLDHPAYEARGAADGPRLALIAGIHGCEYSSIAAVTRFMNGLDASALAGSVLAVPVVNMSTFQARAPFVTPADGKNLNRCFPGDPAGTFSDRLADAIFSRVLAEADAVVDLHGGDLVEALEPFAIYAESEVEERSRAMAEAFGLPYVVREPRVDGGLAGMTCVAAAEAGIPAIIAEAGGCGLLEESAVALLTAGVGNVLRGLGMLPGEPEPPARPQRHVARNLWLRCEHEGWWDAAVRAGEEVGEGQLVGLVRDLWGEPLEEIRAPEPGVVLFLTSSPAVAANGLLLGLGAGLS